MGGYFLIFYNLLYHTDDKFARANKDIISIFLALLSYAAINQSPPFPRLAGSPGACFYTFAHPYRCVFIERKRPYGKNMLPGNRNPKHFAH